MMVKQLSVFLENKTGRLAEVASQLARRKVNIRALSLADSENFGVLRLIVDDAAAGAACLKEAGFVVQITNVIAVQVSDRPGGLSQVLKQFGQAGINVEYMYAFVEKVEDRAVVIFKVENPTRAVKVLKAAGVPLIRSRVLQAL